MTQPPLTLELNFQALLRRWTWFYRLRRGITSGVRGLIFTLAAVLGLCLIAIISSLGLRYGLGRVEFLRLLLLSAAGGVLVAGLGAFFWPVRASRVARLVDSTYHLKERFSTAEELLQAPASFDDQMANHQVTDALKFGRLVQPGKTFFWPVSSAQLGAISGLALVAILVIIFGQPYFQQAAERQAVYQAIQNEIIRLQELQQSIENNPALTPEDKASLQDTLQQATRKLQQAESLEQAVAALSETQQQLQAMENPQAQEQAQALRQLGNQILQSEDSATSPLQDFGQALANGDPLAAAQALKNMDLDNMSAAERQALAEQLSQAAEAVKDTNPALAQQLSQAAQALESNDTASAQQALEQASSELSQAANQIAQAGALREATAQTGEGAERLIQAGRSSEQAQAGTPGQPGQGSEQGAGQSSSQGEGSSNSQGSAQANGQDSGSQPGANPGSGSGKGSADLGNASGPQAGNDPIEQGNGPGDGGERPFVPLSEAQRLGGSGSTDVYLPQSDAQGGEVIGEGNTNPAQPGTSSVPYVEVYPAYEDAYRQAIESGSVPPSLRFLVQKYFSNLEP